MDRCLIHVNKVKNFLTSKSEKYSQILGNNEGEYRQKVDDVPEESERT